MKITLLTATLVFGLMRVVAQNPEGFDTKCNHYIAGTVPLSYPAQLYSILKSPNTVVLDAREKNEFDVSHIKKAIYIGFDQFNKEGLNSISKSDSIYIYCSVGYRSEKIGEKLIELGYKNVFNLYGGIFNWVNSGYNVVDNSNTIVKEVHGYDKEWSRLLNNKRCSIILN